MTGDRIDPETISGLLDGTLSGDERTRALALLAAGGQSYRDFMEAAALQRDLAEDEAATAAVALADIRPSAPAGATPRRRSRTYALAGLATAAAVTMLVVLRPGTSEQNAATLSASILAQRLGTLADGRAVEWRSVVGGDWQPPPLGATRGSGATADASAAGFRVGAHLADLTLAMLLRDSVAADGFVRKLSSFAEESPGGAPIVARLRQIGASGASTSATRDALASELRSATGAEEWFDVGMMLESLRLLGHTSAAGTTDQRSREHALLAEAVRKLARLPLGDGDRARILDALRVLSSAGTGEGAPRAREVLDSAVVIFAR